MKTLKDFMFEPSKNETAVIYGPIPPVRPRIMDSIFIKIVRFLSGIKKEKANDNNRK